jgi:hypothetical protein
MPAKAHSKISSAAAIREAPIARRPQNPAMVGARELKGLETSNG